jgi:hypothetical protein
MTFLTDPCRESASPIDVASHGVESWSARPDTLPNFATMLILSQRRHTRLLRHLAADDQPALTEKRYRID